MKLNEIINRLQELYYIEYDVKDKILFIQSNIKVSDFVLIKKILEENNITLGDLRVN